MHVLEPADEDAVHLRGACCPIRHGLGHEDASIGTSGPHVLLELGDPRLLKGLGSLGFKQDATRSGGLVRIVDAQHAIGPTDPFADFLHMVGWEGRAQHIFEHHLLHLALLLLRALVRLLSGLLQGLLHPFQLALEGTLAQLRLGIEGLALLQQGIALFLGGLDRAFCARLVQSQFLRGLEPLQFGFQTVALLDLFSQANKLVALDFLLGGQLLFEGFAHLRRFGLHPKRRP